MIFDSTYLFLRAITRCVNFPSNNPPLMPRCSTKYIAKLTKPSSPHLPQWMISSMFPVPQPNIDFKTPFSVVSHNSSVSNASSSNSFGFRPNATSLSNSDASGTLAGKSLTKFHNVLMKLSEIGPATGLNIGETVSSCTAVVEVAGTVLFAECVVSL